MTTATEAVKNSGEANTGENQEEVITFSEQQQKRLNEIIETRLARQGKEIRKENETYKSQVANLTKELEEAKEAVKVAKTPIEKHEALDNVDVIKNELEEVKKGNNRIQEEKNALLKTIEDTNRRMQEKDREMINLQKQTKMQFAINKLPFIRPSDILVLTDKFIKYDDDLKDLIVVNEKGMQRYNSSGEPMDLDEYFAEYIQQNKQYAKTEALGGLGSTESKSGADKRYKIEDLFGPNSDPKKAMILKKSDPIRYNQMREQAKLDRLI